MALTTEGAYQAARIPQNSAQTMYGTIGGGYQFDPNLYASLLNTAVAIDVAGGGSSNTPTRQPTRRQLARERAHEKTSAARAKNEAAGGSVGVSGNTRDALIQQLLQEYSNAYSAANRANEGRYQTILGGYNQRYSKAMDLLKGLGVQDRADIIRRGEEAKATRNQDLVSRGLANTTIKQSMERGVDEDVSASLARLSDTLRREQLGYETQLTGDRLAFMERRTDTGPDLSTMLALVSQLGAA